MTSIEVEPGAELAHGAVLRSRLKRGAAGGIVWHVDPKTRALVTVNKHLCIHQRQGLLSALPLQLNQHQL